MERNFDISNFEESLRQHADDFLMVPSKRVWNGIYNDLHPGSKWPSVTIALFFLMTLIGIGYWNLSSTSLRSDSERPLKQNSAPAGVAAGTEEPAQIADGNQNAFAAPAENVSQEFEEDNISDSRLIESQPEPVSHSIGGLLVAGNFNRFDPEEEGVTSEPAKILSLKPSKSTPEFLSMVKAERNLFVTGLHQRDANKIQGLQFQASHQPSNVVKTAPAEASQQVPPQRKKKEKGTEWLFYITPGISSVYFQGKPIAYEEPVTGSSPVLLAPQVAGNSIRVNARVSLTAGTQFKVKLNRGLKLITGAEISTVGYDILANRVHPTFAYLVLKEKDGSYAPHKYMTFYGNGNGHDETLLHNKSMQIALPVGLEQMVWSNENIEISVAAEVAPAFILTSEGFILSADGRNFVSDESLRKNTNLNGRLGSFVSFYSKNLKWQVGPTVGYQMFSTNKDAYPVKEHLVDYGIRIGISK